MQSRINLKLKSNEAMQLFEISANKCAKRTIFNEAKYKILTLYKYAEMRYVYPYVWLLQIKHKILACIDEFDETIEKYKTMFQKRRQRDNSDIQFDAQKHIHYIFRNSIVFNLAESLRKYDELFCLLALAEQVNIYQNKSMLFKAKNRYRSKYWQLLGYIIDTKIHNLPKVTISDYLENKISYQITSRRLGKIDSKMLYNAVYSSDIPFLTEEELELINKILKAYI